MLSGVRVLVAHGDRAARTAMRALLTMVGAEVTEAAAAASTVDRVRRDRPHVLLLEDALCRRDARPVLREIAADPELLGTAVVLLLPGASLDEVVAAVDAGAAEVWSAPGPDPSLVACVRAAHRSRMLLDYALRRHTDLEELAYRDELTGLPNRRGALRRVEVLLSRARRHGQEFSLLLLDADHFKSVNDRYGHAVGDHVLRSLGDRLRERLRGEDIVARWGGEELIVALPDTGEEGAVALGEQLRGAVADAPLDAGEVDVALTVSVGLAAWAGEDVGSLVERADQALYAAKAAGRDRVVVARRAAGLTG
jgi:diguanylate cyclase (GGDEF)-like protein